MVTPDKPIDSCNPLALAGLLCAGIITLGFGIILHLLLIWPLMKGGTNGSH